MFDLNELDENLINESLKEFDNCKKINVLDDLKKEIEKNIASEMVRKKYWWLPLDNYNQPTGNIVELELNSYEYQAMKNKGDYVFDSYYQAMLRAND